MGLFEFDEEKTQLRFPNRNKKYRQDVEFLCGCNAAYCNQEHEPEQCRADSLYGLYHVYAGKLKFRWFICRACYDDIQANGIRTRIAYPGDPSDRA